VDEQDISFPLSVVREAITDYGDEKTWGEFRDLLIMRYNAYIRKRDETDRTILARQAEQEQIIQRKLQGDIE
jgi:hypothetical protein